MTKSKLLLFIVFTLFSFQSFSQQQNWNWYFGQNAALNFSTGVPIAVAGSAIVTQEGCATVSDAMGNLLFYTDGVYVYDRTNTQMPNGFGLSGNGSSTESAVMVPNPANANQYYIFTADGFGIGINYYVVDMTLNAGLGDVVSNVGVLILSATTEKITATKNCSDSSFWVLVHGTGDNIFHVFPITSSGVGADIQSAAGSVNTNGIGYLKVSPDGQRIANALFSQYLVDILNFDNTTGVVSNSNVLNITVPSIYPYGVSFSPNCKVLYEVGDESNPNIYQYDLSSNNQTTIIASQYLVGSQSNGGGGAIQIGPDRKMYINNYMIGNLDVINNPNVLGAGCGYVPGGVTLIGLSRIGLPDFMDSYFSPPTSENINITFCTTPDTLTATGTGSSYLWSTGDTTQSISINTGGTYTVQVFGATACNVLLNITDTFNVTIASQLAVNLGPDTSICGNGPLTLDAGNPGNTYTWSTGATTQTISVNTSGTYWVHVNNGSCIGTDSINVNFVTNPVVNLGPDTTICTGNNITLNAGNNGFSYLWNTGATTQTITTNTTGNYYVRVTLGACTAADTIHISVVNPPVVNLGTDSTFCSNQTVTLNAGNPGDTYTWSTGASTQTINVSTSGTYWVNVSAGGCHGYDTAVMTVIQMPTKNLGNDTNICAGQSITLNAGNPGYNYQWSTGATTQTINVSATGTYWVIVNQGVCITPDSINLTIVPVPQVNIGPDSSVCTGQTVTLTAGNTGDTYLWSTGATTQFITANNSGTYWVLVNNGTCIGSDSMTLAVIATPVVNIGPDSILCKGTTIVLDAGNSGYTYHWSDGSTTQTITVDSAGRYWVMVNNGKCAQADSMNVTIDNPLSPNPGTDTVICGNIYTLSAGITASHYLWSTGDTTKNITVIAPGGHYWIVSGDGRCFKADSINISFKNDSDYWAPPNIFTPNGDGKNELFIPGIVSIQNYHMSIYNRWGELMFETTNPYLYWNGKNKGGSDCFEGTYYWIANYALGCDSSKVIKDKGYLLLKR